ncbi:hypothetical protein OPV22_002802 [Ensete ventricosum]|uniref:Uncharacterized protein n=1 Tax=Ensete ventricosum TaxID=4639 RepID=A0AAV8RYY6_ENSVE|nr:hypothetical protein OPV22_002802 [Ensete ventricosum]
MEGKDLDPILEAELKVKVITIRQKCLCFRTLLWVSRDKWTQLDPSSWYNKNNPSNTLALLYRKLATNRGQSYFDQSSDHIV